MPHHEIPELDSKGLRQFGLILGVVFVILFGCILPWNWELTHVPNFFWIIAGFIVIGWSLAAPDSLRVVYYPWMRVAMVIGHAVNIVILAIVFFIVITPMAIMMRLMGKDPMQRTLGRNEISYRVISKVAHKNHVERPY